MNEFIEQFLLESRELVEQATDDLLVLEKAPADRERLDSAFRAFHTLKGGAGIVEFAAMETAVHAAEDVLASVRSGSRSITSQLIGECLKCLDQVVQWLDAIRDTGEFPETAHAQAATIAARLARLDADGKNLPSDRRSQAPGNWADILLAKHQDLRTKAVTAVRYTPDPDCFFRGEDPIARIAALPDLLSLDIDPAATWPALDALNPFSCNLVLQALTGSPASVCASTLGKAIEQCEIHAVAETQAAGDGRSPFDRARDVLEAQVSLLAENVSEGAAGRMAAAGITAANVFRHLGRTADADRITEARDRALAGREPALLRAEIETALEGPVQVARAALSGSHEQGKQTLRVEAARVDALVNLTGELTVAKNAFGHAARLAQEEGNALAPLLKDRHAVLDRLVGELQRSVLAMRVLPLRLVFQRFQRLMREMSADLGKPANLVIEGDETEADKVIVEMLFEPLLHVLRNAMDHGIESPPERAARGKPPVAVVSLRANRQGEHVVVEISDDGKGIDVARVRQVAAERKVAPDEVLDAMGEAEVIDLIFAPGFSTAAAVTDLSGRGVGMDAVRTAVERLAGKVEIESRAGAGTTVRFTLPFSVMMTRVMTVEAGAQVFGIPLDAIVETVRIGAEQVVPVGAAKAVVMRNRTLPLVDLAGALGISKPSVGNSEVTVVVVRIEGQLGALQVDRLGEQMEVMLKPLDGLLLGLPGIAGSTLLGDGSVLLVLDLGGLLQ